MQPSPDREFAAVDRIFQSGHLAEAQIRAENARSRLSENHYWTARFLIEEAKIRLYQGQSFEAIQLLRDSWTQEANDHDLRIDRFLILALANLRIGNKSQAKEFLLEAEALCDQTPIDTQKKGYVWSTEGIFAYNENHLREALALFQQSLEASKVTGDRFLEAQTLLNLSAVALHQNHYEDAILQSLAAAEIAQRIGAQQTVEVAQGNIGWAYYATGDYQRALVNFNDATASATILGSTIDRETWKNVAGMTEARIGNLDAAQRHYESALALARSLKNASEVSHVEQPLASLLIHRDRPEDAAPYINEAKRLAQQTGDASDIQFGNLLEAQLLARNGNVAKALTLLLAVEQEAKPFPATRLEAEHTLAQIYEQADDKKHAQIWFQRSIATYHSERSQLQSDDVRLPFFENGRDLYMDYVAYLIRNHRTDEALDVIDQGRAETLAEGLGLDNKSMRSEEHTSELQSQ